MSYTQLAEEQRYQIQALLTLGHTQKEIALVVGVDKSTISRELRRNRSEERYDPHIAHQLALQRRKVKVSPRICIDLWQKVEELLCEDWSPEQVSGWLLRRKGLHISHEWIYEYIRGNKAQGGNLYTHLRCKKRHRRRYGSPDRRGQLPNRVSIDDRPSVVDERSRIGDWEADTVVGSRGGKVLVTLTERKSRFSMIRVAPNRTASAVKEAILEMLQPVAEHVHTLTFDNGKEFALHEEIASKLDADAFFAHPYHSWERGLNENFNGLIRQYVPKGSSLDHLQNQDALLIMDKLNNRPRKCLDYLTPNEVFSGIIPPVALTS